MHSLVLILAASLSAAPVAAQTGATEPRAGGLAGLFGGGLPNIAGVGAGNAAGLLGYCLKNNLLGGLAGQGAAPATGTPAATSGGARSILERLTQRQGVTTSPGYQAGQQGQVQTPGGRGLSLGGLRGQVRNQMCGLVLNRARSLL